MRKSVSVCILHPTKAKTPARTLRFQNSVVARGGIDHSLRMANPVLYQLVNLVVIPDIDWNDFILSNDQFKRNPVLQINRDAM